MKITLLSVKSKRKECINKDFMGGFGWAFNAGNSLGAKLINFLKKRGEALPIMSFGYLAAIFASDGHKVSCATNIIPDSDLVIMSSSMVDYDFEIALAKRIKKKGIKVGFIGPFAGFLPELFLGACDFIIKGEPEQAAIDISSGEIKEGVIESPAVENLDSLPFPRWDIFPVKDYSYAPVLWEKPFLPVLSSRGCVNKCNYCPYVISYKYRDRSVNNVVAEIRHLKERFGVKGMIFRDPLFSLKKDFVINLCESILKEKLRLKWVCETKLDLLDKGLLDVMHEAGLQVLNTGIESTNIDSLKSLGRSQSENIKQKEIINYCDKLGIKVTAFYMLGLPGDTVEGVGDTIRYAKLLNTNVAQFFIHTPFPGTEYFNNVRKEIFEEDWHKFDCYHPVLKHKNITNDELLKLKEFAFTSYYFRPRYIIKFIQRNLKGVLY